MLANFAGEICQTINVTGFDETWLFHSELQIILIMTEVCNSYIIAF